MHGNDFQLQYSHVKYITIVNFISTGREKSHLPSCESESM